MNFMAPLLLHFPAENSTNKKNTCETPVRLLSRREQ